MGPLIFDSIVIPTPWEKIFRRLEFKRGRTQLPSEQKKEIESHIEQAVSDLRLKGAGIRIGIREKHPSETVLSTGQALRSGQISAMLAGSEEVLLIGATAGPGIMESIRRDSERNNLTRAVVLDAVASEMTDDALEWIIHYYGHELSREGRRATKKRFSAGYGDFGLENQSWIYQALGLDRLGIEITGSFMLVPEKSVTAVLGIEKIL